MKPKATIILGLCGSGKTYYARKLLAEGKCDRLFDEGFAVEDHQRQEFFELLRDGKHCAVVEICYGIESKRNEFLKELHDNVPGTEVEWIAFEKDFEGANKNCLGRRDKPNDPSGEDHVRLNMQVFGPPYTIPKGATVLPVWRTS